MTTLKSFTSTMTHIIIFILHVTIFLIKKSLKI